MEVIINTSVCNANSLLALSSSATSMATVTSSSSVTTTLVKPQPQWPSRDHMTREVNAAPAEMDRSHSNSLPHLQTNAQQQSVNQSPTSNRPSILRKRPVDRQVYYVIFLLNMEMFWYLLYYQLLHDV